MFSFLNDAILIEILGIRVFYERLLFSNNESRPEPVQLIIHSTLN